MTQLEIQVWAAAYAAMIANDYAIGEFRGYHRAVRAAEYAVEQLREAAASDYFDSLISDHYEDERERAEADDAESRKADDTEAP